MSVLGVALSVGAWLNVFDTRSVLRVEWLPVQQSGSYRRERRLASGLPGRIGSLVSLCGSRGEPRGPRFDVFSSFFILRNGWMAGCKLF